MRCHLDSNTQSLPRSHTKRWRVSAGALIHCATDHMQGKVIANNILLRNLNVKSKQIRCNNNNKCITSLCNTYGIVTVFFKFICFFLFA